MRKPYELEELEECITKRDYIAMARVVHRLKSTARFLGLSSLNPVLEELEEKGRDQSAVIDPKMVDEKFKFVRVVFQDAIEGLEKEIEKQETTE